MQQASTTRGGQANAETSAPATSDRASSRVSKRDKALRAASAAAATSHSGLSDAQVQSIYRRFVKAKQMCGEDTSSIRPEALAKTLRQQLPKLQRRYGSQQVEFQVAIRNGRAVLKAAKK